MSSTHNRDGSSKRLDGLDLARALAVFGMVIVNFKVVMTLASGPDDMYGYLRFIGMEMFRPAPDPVWLVTFTKLFEGRASATFVTLAGVGIGLMAARVAGAGQSVPRNGQSVPRNGQSVPRNGQGVPVRAKLLKRALFLLAAGLTYIAIWPGDILHYYGVYIALATLFLGASGRTLWTAALLAVFLFFAMLVTLDYEKSWNWLTLDYADFWTFSGFCRNTLFNGFHPLFPWIAFLFVGMWLAQRLATGGLNLKKLFWFALAAALASGIVSRRIMGALKWDAETVDPETARALFGTASMPPNLFYMVAAGGTALAAISLSLGIAARWPETWWVKLLAATGRLALTLYVAHVVVGMGLLAAIGRLEGQSLAFSVTCALSFCALAVLFAALWTRSFKRGPLEWLMRRLTG